MIRVGKKYQHLIHGAACSCSNPMLVQASRRLDAFTRRGLLTGAALLAGAAVAPAQAQSTRPPTKTLFRPVRRQVQQPATGRAGAGRGQSDRRGRNQ